jgi:peptidyl-tRNA hydrolase
VTDYILGDFSGSGRGKVKTMLKQTVKTIELILEHGIEKYMSKYNK